MWLVGKDLPEGAAGSRPDPPDLGGYLHASCQVCFFFGQMDIYAF